MTKRRSNGINGFIGKRKSVHPTDTFRKRLRKHELKRNKEQREERRNKSILSRDEESLRLEINKFNVLEKKKQLEPKFLIRKKKLQMALDNLVQAKKRKEHLNQTLKVKGLQKIFKKPKVKNDSDSEEDISNKQQSSSISSFSTYQSAISDNRALDESTLNEEPDYQKIFQKTNLSKEIDSMLNSLENDSEPFFPPGLSLPASIKKPLSNIQIFTSTDSFAMNNSYVGKEHHLSNPNIESYQGEVEVKEKQSENACSNIRENVTIIKPTVQKGDYISGNVNTARRRFEKDLLDPLNPVSANYLKRPTNTRWRDKPEKQQVLESSNIDTNRAAVAREMAEQSMKMKKNIIGPVFVKGSNLEHAGNSEKFVVTEKKLPKDMVSMVPSSVLVKRKKTNNKQNRVTTLDLAPKIDVDKGKQDYNRFLKDIESIETKNK